MSILRGDASEIYALAGDLSQITGKTVPALRGVMDDMGKAVAKDWADNARDTLTGRGAKGKGGSHAWGYPDSIDSELVFDLGGVSVDVGPNVDKKHGFLGRILEHGGEHSPPYLHGLRAIDGFQQRAERMIDAAIGHLF